MLQKIHDRLQLYGIKHDEITYSGGTITIQFPYQENDFEALKLVDETHPVKVRVVEATGSPRDATSGPDWSITPADQIKDDAPAVVRYYWSRETIFKVGPVMLTADMFESVRVDSTDAGPHVEYTMTPEGAVKLQEMTTNNVGKQMAYLIDNTVRDTANILGPVTGGFAEITDKRWTSSEAADFGALLMSGPLPLELERVKDNR
jgi:preprotein translocase subunit SecD